MALEEAQTDYKYIGRPLTLNMHDGVYPSLLSAAFNEDNSKGELKGMVNLLSLLLFVTNLKNIIISIESNGFTLARVTKELVESNIYAIPDNYICAAGFTMLPIFPAISFWIEYVATFQQVSRPIVFALIFTNLVGLLLFPVWLSFSEKTDMLFGAFLFLFNTTVFLKLVSFHHVMHDVRNLVKQVIVYQKENKSLPVNLKENTIFAIPREIFVKALTYPQCLDPRDYIRFMIAPTCSYQLIFPLKPRRNYCQILKRFVQVLLSNLAIVYIFYQHIVPVCENSVQHFENRDYFMIFISLLNAGIPCAYVWLCVFYMVFHCLLNFYAELTRFADCRFYADWWNSGNLSEYWRKWNYPIHNWLVRHIYFPLIRRRMPSDIARLVTFGVSAVFHEYIVMGSFRVFNFMAFLIMIVNIPAIKMQQVFRKQLGKPINNLLFWAVYTVFGQPFAILLCYYQASKASGVQQPDLNQTPSYNATRI